MGGCVGEPKLLPYVSLATVLDELDFLIDRPLPPHMDLQYFVGRGRSRSYARQCGNSFRFIGATDCAFRPDRTVLEPMVDPAHRRGVLLVQMEEAYKPVLSAIEQIDSQINRQKLTEIFQDAYGIRQSSAEKAVAFFLSMGQYTGLMFHRAAVRRRAKRRVSGQLPLIDEAQLRELLAKPEGKLIDQRVQIQRVLELGSAGRVGIALDLPLFEMNKRDRDFTTALIEFLDGYEDTPSSIEEVV